MAKRPSKKTSNNKTSGFVRFLKSEQTRFILGLLICFFSIYLLLAACSFLFTGGADQSALGSEVSKPENIKNWMGLRGAHLADFLINKTFGLASFLFFYLFFSIGLKLMWEKTISIWKRTIFTLATIIWASVFLHFSLHWFVDNSFISPGGKHGEYMYKILADNLGSLGAGLLLVTSLIVILVAISARTIPFFKSMLTLSFLKRGNSGDIESDEPEYEEEEPQEPGESKLAKLKRLFLWNNDNDDDETEDDENDKAEDNNQAPEIDDEEEPAPELVFTVTSQLKPKTPLAASEPDLEIVIPEDEEPYQTSDDNLIITIPDEEEMVREVPTDNYDQIGRASCRERV